MQCAGKVSAFSLGGLATSANYSLDNSGFLRSSEGEAIGFYVATLGFLVLDVVLKIGVCPCEVSTRPAPHSRRPVASTGIEQDWHSCVVDIEGGVSSEAPVPSYDDDGAEAGWK